MLEVFAFLILAFWLLRNTLRNRRNEDRIAKLTARIYTLEQQFEAVRKTPGPGVLQPTPTTEPKPAVIPPRVAAPEPEPEPWTSPPPPPAVVPPPEPEPVAATPPSRPRGRLLNIEETLGTNWLNKLGVVILVIGVALFLVYELRELGPPGKITVGYLVSAAMLAAGIFFERREQWRVLARSALAGGWSLLYFTTYAMYHVPAAHVISSEAADLGLLLLVAAAMVAHTLRYRSQVVTGLAFLLAFTTVNISRGNAYSLIASAILAAALAGVALRRRWFEMELAGIAAAFLNHYLWLRPIIEPMHGRIHDFPGYDASSLLLTAYWLIFRASYVLRRTDGRRQEQISTFAALLNLALYMAVMGYQSVHPERAFQFFLGVGIVELILGQLPITRSRRSAFVVLTTLGVSLIAAAFPRRYAGPTLSITWIIEAQTLLVAGVLLREILYRRLGLLASLLVWIQMVGGDAAQVLGERIYGTHPGGRPGLALFFGIAAAVFYAVSQWIPRRWSSLLDTTLERLCFRRLSHMAAILALIGAWIAWPGIWTAVAWAAICVVLAGAGRRWQIQELSVEAMGFAAVAILRTLAVNLGAAHSWRHLPWLSERLLTVTLVVLLLYCASRWAGVAGIIAAQRIAPAYTWPASGLAGLLAWYELRAVSVAPAWVLLGFILIEIGLRRASLHLRLQAYLAFTAAFLRLFFVNLNAGGPLDELSPRLYTTLPIALAFYFVYLRLESAPDLAPLERRFRVPAFHSFLGLIAGAALARFELAPDLVAAGWAALTLALIALAWKTGRRLFLQQALLLAFGVLFRGLFHNVYARSYFPAPLWHGPIPTLGPAVALLFLTLPFAFTLRRTKAGPLPAGRIAKVLRWLDRRPEQILFYIPFVLLTALIAVEVRIGLVTLVWGVEAVAVFLFAIRVKERSYRLCGLGLLLVCVAKIVVRDVWGLVPRDRYLTFIVLGAALLGVSYLYTRYRDVLRQYL